MHFTTFALQNGMDGKQGNTTVGCCGDNFETNGSDSTFDSIGSIKVEVNENAVDIADDIDSNTELEEIENDYKENGDINSYNSGLKENVQEVCREKHGDSFDSGLEENDTDIPKEDSMDSYSCGLCLTEFSERLLLMQHLNWHIMMDTVEGDTNNACLETCSTNSQLEQKLAMKQEKQTFDQKQDELHGLQNGCVGEAQIESTDESQLESGMTPSDFQYALNLKSKVGRSTKKRSFKLDCFAGTFTRISSPKRRKNGDIKFYKCCICNQTFKTRYLLKVHERSHTGENPYKCEFCDGTFSCVSSLNLHKQIHTDSKEYKCEECHKTFVAKRYLQRHKVVHKDVKDYICDVCGKAFVQKSNLKEHQKIHSGERPYACDICDCTFPRSYDLSLHLKKHTGEKPHICEICGNSFRRKIDLKYHKRIHSGERPYWCVPCQKTYITSSSLSLHNKRVHSGVRSGSLFVSQSNLQVKLESS